MATALDALRALANKKPLPTADGVAQVQDPAIAGATRSGATVKLGLDPAFKEVAAQASALKAALEKAEENFSELQGEVRNYGKAKRDTYNDTFKSNVTTVSVPYEVETPTGNEVRFVQVVCSNRYTVQKDVILNNRAALGGYFDKLFAVESSKKLKPNAEGLIRSLLGEMGLAGTELDNAMDGLFDTEQKVSTREDYEAQSKAVIEDSVKTILAQGVSRSSPSLKF